MKNLAPRIATLAVVMALWPATALAAPSVSIDASTLTPGTGDVVTFTGKSSSTITSWQWDFDYQGGSPTYDATGKTVQHAFPRGQFIVVLVARDSGGNYGYNYVRVTSDRLEPSIKVDPATPVTGQAATLTPDVPFPDGGSVSSYAWDLDNDGQFDDSTDPSVTVTYDQAGPRTVGLQVIDDLGTTATATKTFDVVQPDSPPPAPGDTGGNTGGSDGGTPNGGATNGDLGSGSGSSPDPVLLPGSALRLLHPRPFIHIKGHTTGRGAQIDLFSVRAPGGAKISLRCKGRTCPLSIKKRAIRGSKARTVRFKAIQGWLRAGIVLEVRVTKKGFVGRFTRFRIGKLKPPVRWDGCLFPGSNTPKDC